jgi:hypothetical protein
MTEERLKEIRARANAAHKGPWHIHEGDLVDANHQDVFADWEEAYGPNEDSVGPDTQFICNAQEDIVALLADRDTLAKKLKVAIEALEYYSLMFLRGVNDPSTKARNVLKEIADAK